MSARHQGRHRAAHGGSGRGPEQVAGRHRTAAGPPAATRPLLVASGTVAAALTAIVLSGAQGPLGALFPERDDEPRPATASASPRGGAPTAGDLAQVARGYAAGSGGMGSSWGASIWDVLFQQQQQQLGEPGSGSGSGMLDDGSASAVAWLRGTGPAAGGTPFLASAGTPSAPLGTAPSAPPAAASTSSALGSGEPARTGTQDPQGGAPAGGAESPAPTTEPPADDDAPAAPLLVPGPVQTLPPAPETEPVIEAAEPVITAAEPVIRAAEPVITSVEPEPTPVPELEPVQEALESVGGAASEAPEPEELPAGTGDDLYVPEVKLPG